MPLFWVASGAGAAGAAGAVTGAGVGVSVIDFGCAGGVLSAPKGLAPGCGVPTNVTELALLSAGAVVVASGAGAVAAGAGMDESGAGADASGAAGAGAAGVASGAGNCTG